MRLRHLLLLGLLAAIWGSSYLLIKYALEDFSPGFVVFARCAVASVSLLAVIAAVHPDARGALRVIPRRRGDAVLLGVLAVAIPFLLISFGELEVPSGLTAVLIAPASLFVALFAPLLDRSEAIGGSQAVGLVVGLVGVALLVGVESIGSAGQFLGALAILAASASYALSSYVVKHRFAGVPPIATSATSVTVAALVVAPLALATAPDHAPALRSVLALIALGVVHTGIAFVIFYELIGALGAGRASLVSYLAPAVALAYGAALLDEAITSAALGGLALILLGMWLAARRPLSGAEPAAAFAGEGSFRP